MTYWDELKQIVGEEKEEEIKALLKCFFDKDSVSKASADTKLDAEFVNQFYLKARQACWLNVSGGHPSVDDGWLYVQDKTYLFFRLVREEMGREAIIYIQPYSPEGSVFETYKNRQKNSGWIYLMRPGKYVSVYPEDHRLYTPQKQRSHLDTYKWGLVGFNVENGLILKPTGLRRKKRETSKKDPPILKSAYLDIVSEMKSEGMDLDEFLLMLGERLLRFNRTSKRIGPNEDLFCNDIMNIFRDWSSEEIDAEFPPLKWDCDSRLKCRKMR